MSIHESQLANLRAFGYTQAEAQFLYLVAAHSGYFTVRQFLDFSQARSGKRNARFVEKLFGLGHVSAQRYMRRSLVYSCIQALRGQLNQRGDRKPKARAEVV